MKTRNTSDPSTGGREGEEITRCAKIFKHDQDGGGDITIWLQHRG